jgi:hypothetical protein
MDAGEDYKSVAGLAFDDRRVQSGNLATTAPHPESWGLSCQYISSVTPLGKEMSTDSRWIPLDSSA